MYTPKVQELKVQFSTFFFLRVQRAIQTDEPFNKHDNKMKNN